MKANDFALLRLLADGAFHSGERLAEQLGCSRALVCARLKQLSQSHGLVLHSVRGQGYQLASKIDWLNLDEITRYLAASPLGFALELVDTTTSTNSDMLQRAAEGEASRLVCLAETQTAGRGRYGRIWQSQLGSALTFSVLWRFQCGVSQLSGLSLVVGLAVLHALQENSVPSARLKWPNDVLFENRKLAGILIELSGDALGPSAVVIGIGVNFSSPEGVEQETASVADMRLSLSRNKLAADILIALAVMLPRFEQQGFAAFRQVWEGSHGWQGERVTLLPLYGEPSHGIALGVDDSGALRLLTTQGETAIHAGEVSLRRTT